MSDCRDEWIILHSIRFSPERHYGVAPVSYRRSCVKSEKGDLDKNYFTTPNTGPMGVTIRLSISETNKTFQMQSGFQKL